MFDSKMFGFGSKRSSIDALAEVTDQIRQGRNDALASIFVSLCKAFDSISHEILLAKSEKYGLKGICFKLFESNMKKQQRCV